MGPNPPHSSVWRIWAPVSAGHPGHTRCHPAELLPAFSCNFWQSQTAKFLIVDILHKFGPLESLLAADPPPLQRGHPSAGVLVIQMSFVKQLHCAKSCLCLVSCPRFAETEVFLAVIDGNDVCSPSAGAASHVLAIRR